MEKEILKRHIRVPKTARYYLLGNPDGEIETLIFVVHGISMLAEDFIVKFQMLSNEKNLIIAPEGLSRYYTDKTFQKVGAGWMTREDRLNEIEDHVGYLEMLCEEIIGGLPAKPSRIIVIGFSQGVATTYRWILKGKFRVDDYVIWAGTAPEEDAEEMKTKLAAANLWLWYGKTDEVIPLDKCLAQMEWMKKIHPKPEIHLFNDGHRINEDALAELKKRLGI